MLTLYLWFYLFLSPQDQKVEHYRVISRRNKVTVDEERYFGTLVELVKVSQYLDLSFHVILFTLSFFGVNFCSLLKELEQNSQVMPCLLDKFLHGIKFTTFTIL